MIRTGNRQRRLTRRCRRTALSAAAERQQRWTGWRDRLAMKITKLEAAHFVIGIALVFVDLVLRAVVDAKPNLSAPEWLRAYGLGYFTAGVLVSVCRPGAPLVAGAGVFVTALLLAVLWPGSWDAEELWVQPPLLLGGATMAGEVFGAAAGGVVRWARSRSKRLHSDRAARSR